MLKNALNSWGISMDDFIEINGEKYQKVGAEKPTIDKQFLVTLNIIDNDISGDCQGCVFNGKSCPPDCLQEQDGYNIFTVQQIIEVKNP